MTESSSEQELTGGAEAIIGGSAFDPANFNTVLLIMLNRLYDINLAFLATVNPAKAQELYEMHERGIYLAPPPSIAMEEDDD